MPRWLSIISYSTCARVSSTGIRQISYRFISEIGLLLLFPDYRFLRVLYLAFSALTPPKPILLHCFAIKGSMFKEDCLFFNNDNSNAFLSRYVMLCHAFRHVE